LRTTRRSTWLGRTYAFCRITDYAEVIAVDLAQDRFRLLPTIRELLHLMDATAF